MFVNVIECVRSISRTLDSARVAVGSYLYSYDDSFMGILTDSTIVLCARFTSAEYVRNVRRMIELGVEPLHTGWPGRASEKVGRLGESASVRTTRQLSDLCIVQDGQVRFELESEYAVPDKGIVSAAVWEA